MKDGDIRLVEYLGAEHEYAVFVVGNMKLSNPITRDSCVIQHMATGCWKKGWICHIG